jgi:hypothetical protein
MGTPWILDAMIGKICLKDGEFSDGAQCYQIRQLTRATCCTSCRASAICPYQATRHLNIFSEHRQAPPDPYLTAGDEDDSVRSANNVTPASVLRPKHVRVVSFQQDSVSVKRTLLEFCSTCSSDRFLFILAVRPKRKQ